MGIELELQDIAWQKKDLVQKRRQLDSEITAKFLADNGPLVQQAVRRFMEKLEAGAHGLVEHYYLKGGNAIAVLEGEAMTGDYDFQLVPTQNVYQNWRKRRIDVETLIFSALEEAAKTLVQSRVDESAFEVERLQTGKDRLVKKNKITGKVVIGSDYYEKSCSDILKDPHYKKETRRLELTHAGTPLAVGDGTREYYIYANYTIPEFLLYRLVISYGYELTQGGRTEEIPLKSEMIDVSIPRVGSAECYLSQEGVITHFRRKDGFLIPGWGYHFYENINLCQEVSLHYSGSPHKRGKRINRLKRAISALAACNGNNPDVLLGEKMSEDDGAGTHETLAYAGAMNYPVGQLAAGEDQPSVFKELYQKLLAQTLDHMTTVRAQWDGKDPLADLAKLLVVFRAQKSMDTNIIPASQAKDVVTKLFLEAGEFAWQSPLDKLPGDLPFHLGFVVVSTSRMVLQKLSERGLLGVPPKAADRENNLLLPANCRGGQFYIILHIQGTSGGVTLSSKQLLESSILFSQRLILQEALK
ncbi:MAG: hypothetical protein NC417_08875 [Candidatus Gastranaerophilales bacterium]|nr:hypothetical protein [Candidatus Gastranaerophilales bacterium]